MADPTTFDLAAEVAAIPDPPRLWAVVPPSDERHARWAWTIGTDAMPITSAPLAFTVDSDGRPASIALVDPERLGPGQKARMVIEISRRVGVPSHEVRADLDRGQLPVDARGTAVAVNPEEARRFLAWLDSRGIYDPKGVAWCPGHPIDDRDARDGGDS